MRNKTQVVDEGAFSPSCHPDVACGSDVVYQLPLMGVIYEYSSAVKQAYYLINYVKVGILVVWITIKGYLTTRVKYDCTINYVVPIVLQSSVFVGSHRCSHIEVQSAARRKTYLCRKNIRRSDPTLQNLSTTYNRNTKIHEPLPRFYQPIWALKKFVSVERRWIQTSILTPVEARSLKSKAKMLSFCASP